MPQFGMTGLNEFKNSFSSVRPTLFRVSIQKPPSDLFFKDYLAGKEGDFYFYCKGATIPASKIQPIEVGFMGRKFYEHGDREFDPWTITLYNSQDFKIRSFFEYWMHMMNQHEDNRQTQGATGKGSGHFAGFNQSDYYGYYLDLKVEQLDRRNNAIYAYNFVNAFPTELGEIQLDYTSTNTIEEFTCSLQYNYWVSVDADNAEVTGSAGAEFTESEQNITNLGL